MKTILATCCAVLLVGAVLYKMAIPGIVAGLTVAAIQITHDVVNHGHAQIPAPAATAPSK